MKETHTSRQCIGKLAAQHKWAGCLWIGTVATILIWTSLAYSGWDAAVYQRAMHAVSVGRDPYLPESSAQTSTGLAENVTSDLNPPLGYIYPPATLLLLRGVGTLPERPTIFAYWLLYIASTLSLLWVGMQFVRPAERRWFLLLVPIAPFFPGLLADGVLLGGNIAFILYAAVLLAATLGWRTNRWFWFYAAVLVASVFKPPYLSLIAIAPFSARRQWVPAVTTAIVGLAAFTAQAVFLPHMFHQYLQALDHLFQRRRDFGCSPAGLITDLLFGHNISYFSASIIIYLTLALPLLFILLHLSRHYLDGLLSSDEWFPILLTGVILLNPRLIEYDVAPITLPLALVGWRVFAPLCIRFGLRWIVCSFLVLNALSLSSWSAHKVLDGMLIVSCFAAGCWRLLKVNRRAHSRQILTTIKADAQHLASEV